MSDVDWLGNWSNYHTWGTMWRLHIAKITLTLWICVFRITKQQTNHIFVIYLTWSDQVIDQTTILEVQCGDCLLPKLHSPCEYLCSCWSRFPRLINRIYRQRVLISRCMILSDAFPVLRLGLTGETKSIDNQFTFVWNQKTIFTIASSSPPSSSKTITMYGYILVRQQQQQRRRL